MQETENQKLKVVWLCGFTNQMVQDRIKPWKRVGEIAPWITGLIKVFEENENVELHIVTPHQYISRTKHFTHKGVHYHFFNQGLPVWGRRWPSFFPADLWMDYFFIKRKIKKLVNSIKPDIIHLHGAENTYHTSGVLQFHGQFPVFITVQGFIGKSSSTGKRAMRRKERESQIYKTFRHFGYRTKTMGDNIKEFNPEAVLHWHQYYYSNIDPIDCEKKYDLVFFARVTKEKGIEDLLHALVLLKNKKQDISLCVIGAGNLSTYKLMAEELKLDENIYWAGFLPTQKEVHKLVSHAKISVLPTHHDMIPGTIIESLFLKLPVVAYNVGGISELNEKDTIVQLVEKFNIKELAGKISFLLDDNERIKNLGDMGSQRAKEIFGNSKKEIFAQICNAYLKTIKDFEFHN